MNNVTIEGNPCASVDKHIKSDGTFKVAKMSQLEKTPKIQTLKSRWQTELGRLAKTDNVSKVSNEVSNAVSASSVMEKLDATVIDYYDNLNTAGARKLKVNPVVAVKARKVYGTHESIKLVKKVEEVKEETNINELNNLVKEEIPMEEPMADSRMSRLERASDALVNEVPSVNNNNNNNVNPPISRFERYNENPYDALINDTPSKPLENEYEEHVRTVETKGGDPNLYNELIHGSKNDDVSTQLLDARNKLSSAQKERAKAKAVNKSLEDEVLKLRETIEAIKREKQEKDEKELSNTLNMLEATKEEILGETRKYDNLQEELAELIRQRDSLLNGGSAYDDNNFSRGRI